MLEKIGDFFDNRLNDYDSHQLNNIQLACEFYPFTASCLPHDEKLHILDLGCGIGLELEYYYETTPYSKITGIDLAPGMLARLCEKFCDKNIEVICGSYFDVPFGENIFDCAVSVESLHHFTKEEKLPLYNKLYNSLKENGYFILTDYFSLSDDEEKFHRRELLRLKAEQGIKDNEIYHYDTPLTTEHEKEALLEAGFSDVKILNNWGQTFTMRAEK